MEQANTALGALQVQRDQLQSQLDAAGDQGADALLAQLQDAQKSRDEQLALKASQEKYIEDLKLLDAESLKATIAGLETEIAANEAAISEARGLLEAAITNRDAVHREVDDLRVRIGALEQSLATAVPEVTAAPENTAETSATDVPEATEIPETTTDAEGTEIPEATIAADGTEIPEATLAP